MSKGFYPLLERLIEKYKETGQTEFLVEDYIDIPGHQEAIQELIHEGIADEANNILQTLTIDLDRLKEYLRNN